MTNPRFPTCNLVASKECGLSPEGNGQNLLIPTELKEVAAGVGTEASVQPPEYPPGQNPGALTAHRETGARRSKGAFCSPPRTELAQPASERAG